MGNAEQDAANRLVANQYVANQYVADWYFDFVSPFAYLQSEQLAALAPRITVRYKPVLFAGLLGAHGQLGPAEIPAKRAFTYRFVLWQAKRLGIPLKLPHEHPFNPLPLLRLAIACDCEASAIHRIFRFVWRDGRLPDLPIEWAELTNDLGLPNADTRMAEPEVKGAAGPIRNLRAPPRCPSARRAMRGRRASDPELGTARRGQRSSAPGMRSVCLTRRAAAKASSSVSPRQVTWPILRPRRASGLP